MEHTMKVLTIVLKCVCLAICIGLIIIGQKRISYNGLYMMVAGLCGVLLLLYFYNKKYR